MLEGITWSTYLTAIAVAMAVYYATIGMLYYRNEIHGLIKGKTKNRNEAAGHAEEDTVATDPKSGFDGLQEVVASIRAILEQAGKEVSKEELLTQVNTKLANYDGLRQPAFRNAIRNFITINAKAYCEVDFTDDELESSWEPWSVNK